MVVISNPEDYTLVGFQKSATPGKKIDAILKGKDGKTRKIPFGQKGSETYQNKTGVKVDSIHSDPLRRKAYRARHKGEEKKKYSSGWFSWYLLWILATLGSRAA